MDEEVAGTTVTTAYQRNVGKNEYLKVTQPNGDQHNWLYDGNGNLLSDGYYIYVYDHLDRLSETYVLTYPGGATDSTPTGTIVQVYGLEVQKRRDGKETNLSTQLWRSRVEQARSRLQAARIAAGMSASDPRVPFGANSGTTGTSAAAVDQAVPVLVAHYGYDPSNRRIGKLFPDFSGAIYAWSGWDMVESYDIVFTPTTVWFEGAVTDEHLGYARRNSSTGTWTRFSYVRDHTRGVVGVTDAFGLLQEIYEFDPYGRMSVFSPTGVPLGQVPTVDGQIYGFCGRQFDAETGLLYYRNRYYHPQHGRFLTNDPTGAWFDAMALGNSYSFCGSAPMTLIDPLGLFTTVVVILTGDPKTDARSQKIAKARAERDPDGGRVMVFGGDGEGGGRGSGYRKTSDEKIPPLRKKPPGKRPSGKQPADWRRYDALVVADGQSVWEGRHRVVVLYGHANEDGDQIPFEDDGTVEDAIEELPKDPPRPGSEPVPVYVEVCKLAAATPDPKRNIAKYLKDRLPGERFVVYG